MKCQGKKMMYERVLISVWKNAPNFFMEYISFHKISIKVILGFEAYS